MNLRVRRVTGWSAMLSVLSITILPSSDVETDDGRIAGSYCRLLELACLSGWNDGER